MASVTVVRERLLQKIAQLRLSGRDRLPAERELENEIATSRPTLRKVMRELEAAGQIERRGQAGTFLVSPAKDRVNAKGAVPRPSPASTSPLVSFMLGHPDSDRQLHRWAHDHLKRLGVGLHLYIQTGDGAHWNVRDEALFFESLLELRPRGVVVHATPLGGTNADLLRRLDAAGIRVVHLDYFRETLPDQPFILPDWVYAGALAVATLAARGCRFIAVDDVSGGAPFVLILRRGIRHAAGVLGLEVRFFNRADASGLGNAAESYRALPHDAGVIMLDGPLVDAVAIELAKAFPDPSRRPELIGVGDYDPRFDPAVCAPVIHFPYRPRVAEAMDYAANGGEPAPRRLVKPSFCLPKITGHNP